MSDGLKALMFCAAAILPLAAAAQVTGFADRQQMAAQVAALSDPQAAITLAEDADTLMQALGLMGFAQAGADLALPIPDVPPFRPDGAAVIELVDIRLLLTQIAIQTGARDHVALVRAQGATDHGVILLRGGFAGLRDLAALAKGTPAQNFVTQTAAGLVLTRPLAIWADAGLSLEDGDWLILAQPSGSFVANLGWLNLSGGTIIGAGGPNLAEPSFRPFVLTAGRGSLTARGATFRALGFGDAAVFGGVVVVNNGLVPPRFASSVAGSTLTDVRSLGVFGTAGTVLATNRITGSDGTAILISDARASVVGNNRLSQLTGPQAIRVTAGASDVTIRGNLVSGAPRSGILIDRGSSDVAVSGNLVQGSLTTGIGIDRAACIAINTNIVARNGGAGISLSNTDGAVLGGNAILFNQGSGVVLRNQAATAQAHVDGNVFAGNHDGLRGASPGKVMFGANNFEAQMPQVFSGDLAPLMVAWLRDRRDGAAPVMVAARLPARCPPVGAE